MQTGDRGTALMIEWRDVFPRTAQQKRPPDHVDRDSAAIPISGQFLVGRAKRRGYARLLEKPVAHPRYILRLFRIDGGIAALLLIRPESVADLNAPEFMLIGGSVADSDEENHSFRA